jgi:hypothetical protein
MMPAGGLRELAVILRVVAGSERVSTQMKADERG